MDMRLVRLLHVLYILTFPFVQHLYAWCFRIVYILFFSRGASALYHNTRRVKTFNGKDLIRILVYRDRFWCQSPLPFAAATVSLSPGWHYKYTCQTSSNIDSNFHHAVQKSLIPCGKLVVCNLKLN